VKPVVTLWKRMMLNLPTRAIWHGINNLIGHLEGVSLAVPGI